MLTQFLREEKGQTTVEYILIIAVVVVAISLLGKGISKKLPETINQVFDGINKKIGQLMNASMQN